MTVLINIIGLVLIGLIIWWFWLVKSKTQVATHESIEILVENAQPVEYNQVLFTVQKA